MTNKERLLAALNCQPYDRMPVVHFGFWKETVQKWLAEGRIEKTDNSAAVAGKLGFDCGWGEPCLCPNSNLDPLFETKVLETLEDGSRKVLNNLGMVILEKQGATGIPAEVDHLLKGRKEWEDHYLPRMQFTEERLAKAPVYTDQGTVRFDEGGREWLQKGEWENPYGFFCGSLYGAFRNWVGVAGSAYLYADDEELFDEIINTSGELSYLCTEAAMKAGIPFDYGHFWEDICFKNGPLVVPSVFDEKVGPHYKRITELLNKHGINIVSLDCDGCIDALIPTWLENGVNTMFPIEVGTWNASIEPWRKEYGKELRGVGGMDKRVFAQDVKAVDAEVDRLRRLVDLGGYVPCPDHRIPPDAKWENVHYYCEKMRDVM